MSLPCLITNLNFLIPFFLVSCMEAPRIGSEQRKQNIWNILNALKEWWRAGSTAHTHGTLPVTCNTHSDMVHGSGRRGTCDHAWLIFTSVSIVMKYKQAWELKYVMTQLKSKTRGLWSNATQKQDVSRDFRSDIFHYAKLNTFTWGQIWERYKSR